MNSQMIGIAAVLGISLCLLVVRHFLLSFGARDRSRHISPEARAQPREPDSNSVPDDPRSHWSRDRDGGPLADPHVPASAASGRRKA